MPQMRAPFNELETWMRFGCRKDCSYPGTAIHMKKGFTSEPVEH